MASAAIEAKFDLYLKRYQKLSLFIFVPALLNFLGLCIALPTKGIAYTLCFSTNYILSYHLAANPINNNNSIGNAIVLGVGVVTIALFALLAINASKAKRQYLYVACTIYLIDWIYGITLGFPDVYGQLSLGIYIGHLIYQTLILGFLVFLVVVYVKLLRVNAERISNN